MIAKRPPPPDSPFWRFWEGFTRLNVVVFRASRGRVGASLGGAPVLLLHHVGRRSGKARVSPLIFLADGPNVVVVASKAGVDRHPAWFHNLMAMQIAEVELRGGERRGVRPVVAEGAERERLWSRLVEIWAPYAEYQTFTSRRIPVVVLEPAPAGVAPPRTTRRRRRRGASSSGGAGSPTTSKCFGGYADPEHLALERRT